MSTLYVNNIDTESGTDITIPTGKKLVVTDEGGLAVPGTVVQVVQSTNTQNIVIGSTGFIATHLQADITPKFATSKILIMVNGGVDTNVSGRAMRTTIYRDNTTNLAALASGQQWFGYDIGHNSRLQSSTSMQFLDNPSTTNSVNYRVYGSSSDGNNVEYPGTFATKVMILMEIAQ